ncbi:DNA repair protein rhp54 [Hordeum vulgare]|nr:DNA repair protein rhp54 [Hordeum vulgare]
MDDDTPTLDAAAGLASLASAVSRDWRKGTVPAKKKKVLMPVECVEQSLRRKNRWHQQEAANEATIATTLVVTLEQEANIVKNSQLVRESTRQTLLILGLNPGQHELVAAAAVTANTGSSYLRHQLPDSPRMSSMLATHDFYRNHPQTSHLSYSTGFGSLQVSMVAPGTPSPTGVDLNTMLVGGGSSSAGVRKRPRELATDAMGNAHNLFDGMSVVKDEANRVFMVGLIFEGCGGGISFDPDETQSQDGMGYSSGEGMADPLMEDQLSLGNSFLLDHQFPVDYGLDEEDDEVDIDGEPLLDELPVQPNAKKNKRKSKRTKAYTQNEDKLLSECWRDVGQDPEIGSEQKASTFWQRVHRDFHECNKFKPYQMERKCGLVSLGKRWRVIQQECNELCSTLESIEARPVSDIDMKDLVFQDVEAFMVHYEGKSFNLTHCWMIINLRPRDILALKNVCVRTKNGSLRWTLSRSISLIK